jgi:hypothetical protein
MRHYAVNSLLFYVLTIKISFLIHTGSCERKLKFFPCGTKIKSHIVYVVSAGSVALEEYVGDSVFNKRNIQNDLDGANRSGGAGS